MVLRRDWWKFLLLLSMSVIIIAAFLYAPRAKDLGETTRILFFHVPCAWVASVAFLVAAIHSGLYLRKGEQRYDIYAFSAAQIGTIFTVLATVTGAIWAAEIWGHPWNWDPRQTSIFLLLLIYAAYFALRSSIEDDDKRARLAAVYAILAFVTVPFLMYIVPRVYESLHPDPLINNQGKVQMNSRMQQVFFASWAVFTLLFYWMMKLRSDLLSLTNAIRQQKYQQNR